MVKPFTTLWKYAPYLPLLFPMTNTDHDWPKCLIDDNCPVSVADAYWAQPRWDWWRGLVMMTLIRKPRWYWWRWWRWWYWWERCPWRHWWRWWHRSPQILRMLHVDRQGGTWRLLGSVVFLHRWLSWCCHRLSLDVTMCDMMWQCLTWCDNRSLGVTICHMVWQYVTRCNNMSHDVMWGEIDDVTWYDSAGYSGNR